MWSITIGSSVVCLLVMIGFITGKWVYKWRNPKSEKGRLPPGSMGLPFIGETFQFFSRSKTFDVPLFLRTRIHKYGKIFKTSVAGRAVVMSADVEFNHYILQQEGKLVELWYMDSFAELVGQRGPLKEVSTAGALHKNLKKLIQEHIGIESLKTNLLPQIEDIVNRTLQSWANRNQPVELKSASSKMTMDLSLGIMVGYDPEKSDPNMSHMFTKFRRGLLSFPLKLPGTTLHACLQVRMITDTLESKRQRSPRPSVRMANYDMLDRLIDDDQTHVSLNDKAISYVMFALLFANAETIPTVLTLAVKLLLENPLAMEELTKENEEIVRRRESKESDGSLTWKEYKSMSFTMNVINEILRLNGSLGIVRRAIDDIHVNGYVIPKGWTVALMPTAVYMNSEPYADPLSFNPWRWKHDVGNGSNKGFVPFGGGMRTCVGAEYSKVLMAVFLHVLVTKYRWKNIRGGEVYRDPTLQFCDGYYIQLHKKDA
ncbi:Cytochrome P450 87A3 [Linum perenne]